MLHRAVSLKLANEFVATHHRHHGPVRGHKFSIGAFDPVMVGVAIIGRPVARGLDDGRTVEITRLCTDGSRNACSFLYGACHRAARALGYERLLTYILETENGASLRAANFVLVAVTGGGSWNCNSRPRVDHHSTVPKHRYEARV